MEILLLTKTIKAHNKEYRISELEHKKFQEILSDEENKE